MRNFFYNIFSENDGTSSKRIFGGVGLISLIVFMFMYPSNDAMNIVGWVTAGYAAGTVVEKYSRGNYRKQDYENFSGYNGGNRRNNNEDPEV
jgi:hypothetical protein